jgi:hypothetical protein
MLFIISRKLPRRTWATTGSIGNGPNPRMSPAYIYIPSIPRGNIRCRSRVDSGLEAVSHMPTGVSFKAQRFPAAFKPIT